jgi:hypothetical protein
MLEYLRTHWRLVSTGMLALTLLGAGGTTLYAATHGDCCGPGMPCCHLGSPCCPGHAAPSAPR